MSIKAKIEALESCCDNNDQLLERYTERAKKCDPNVVEMNQRLQDLMKKCDDLYDFVQQTMCEINDLSLKEAQLLKNIESLKPHLNL